MADVKKKSQIRGGHRGYVKQVIKNARTIIAAKDPAKLQSLKQLSVTLKDKLGELKSLDSEIAELLETDEAIDREVFESCQFADEMRECITEIETFMEAKVSSNSDYSSSLDGAGGNCSGQSHAKLPKLRLESFAGNPVQWSSFWDSLQSAVHNNNKLTSVDRFTYLKSLLEGTAASTIAGLTLTNDNYEKAVQILKDRFGNKQVIITSHMETLTRTPRVESIADVKELRSLYDRVESNIRGLESVGIKSEMYGCFLLPILLQKLPEEFRILITRDQSSETWVLKDIMEAFHKELKVREQCTFTARVSKNDRKSAHVSRGKSSYSSSVARLSGGGQVPSHPSKTVWCAFCKQQHQSSKCSIVTDPGARKQILKDRGRCFLCLRSGHLSKNCNSGIRCFNCQFPHHVSICSQKVTKYTPGQGGQPNPTPSQREQPTHATTQEGETKPKVTLYVDHSRDSVLLQTAKANVLRPDDTNYAANVRLVFDSCSQRSYVTEELKKFLNLQVIGKDSLLIKTFGESDAKLRTCEIVQVAIQTLDGTLVYIQAYVVPTICGPLSQQPTELAQERFEHLQGMTMADSGNENLPISMLIGADFYWALVDGEVVRGYPSEPVALSTKLGYVLSGRTSGFTSDASSVNLTATHVLKVETAVVTEDPLRSELNKFWDYESLGIQKQENSVYDRFVEDVEFVNGMYQVRLPFKEDHELIPDNFRHSKSRLNYLLKRLKSQPDVLSQYDSVIQDQLSKGIIEPVLADVSPPLLCKVHYIPHREVIRADKETTKLRIVYDASSHAERDLPSLNNCLYAGPPMSPLISDILLRFRAYEIALASDLEKAFLNVSVDPADRDYLRFVWANDIASDEPELCVYRFARVVFGVSSSPFLLNATIRYHLTRPEVDREFAEEVLKSLYVDDYVGGSVNENSAFDQYKDLKSCFVEAGFNMRKWVTNSHELQERIEKSEGLTPSHVSQQTVKSNVQEDDQTYPTSQFGNSGSQSTVGVKVLGHGWDTKKDLLMFEFEPLPPEGPVSKRAILSATAKFYYPLGLLGPIIVLFKILFQTVCRSQASWDDPLDPDSARQWQTLVSDLRQTKVIAVERYYSSDVLLADASSIQIHGFSDASEVAYGAVVYLRIENKSGNVLTKLVTSKTRVAPIKGETIPRLELMGTVVLARLINSVLSAFAATLRIDDTFCWVDSQIALWWIWGTSKEFKQFIQNRVLDVRRLVKPEHWNYCPTESNPADIVSRGAVASKLVDNKLWWSGPEFLQSDQSQWPRLEKVQVKEGLPTELKAKECGKGSCPSDVTTLATETGESVKLNLESIIPSVNYSDVQRLFRVTACVLRFVENLKRKLDDAETVCGDIQEEEINVARDMGYREVQRPILQDSKFNQYKISLSLYTDEKIILRCVGRIRNASLPHDMKFPILLPRNSHFTRLITLACHEKVLHNGIRDTLTELRTQFWIPSGRRVVQTVIAQMYVMQDN